MKAFGFLCLGSLACILYYRHPQARESSEEESEKKKARTDPFADLRDDRSASQQENLPADNISSEEELERYKVLRVPSTIKNPLQFWCQRAAEYPILANTARRIYSISASSAQSERDFSSVGHTITDMRSRLSADKVEAIELVRWGMRAGLLK